MIIFLPASGSLPFYFNQFGWILESESHEEGQASQIGNFDQGHYVSLASIYGVCFLKCNILSQRKKKCWQILKKCLIIIQKFEVCISGAFRLSWLAHLFNVVWRSVTADWGSWWLCSNYRGVTLLILYGKTFARVLEESQTDHRSSDVVGVCCKTMGLNFIMNYYYTPVYMCCVDLALFPLGWGWGAPLMFAWAHVRNPSCAMILFFCFFTSANILSSS